MEVPLVDSCRRGLGAHLRVPRAQSSRAARRIARKIYGQCARLKDAPNIGKPSRRMEGRRELTFAPLPYIVVYQVRPEAVEISRIFHGAQDWP